MAEWQLYEPGTVPEWTTGGFFAHHPWIDPKWQRGHTERIQLAREVTGEAVDAFGISSIVDLGCGDGSLLATLADLDVTAWGYDLGEQNIEVARHQRGVDARLGDFMAGPVEYGELIVATEVVEHLLDPYSFLRGLPGERLVISSPFDEDDQSHYEHHAFAWDEAGYRDLVTACGWAVMEQRTCPAGFQAIFAVREGS